MGKFWLFAVCFFGLIQNVFCAINRNAVDLDLLIPNQPHAAWQPAVAMPQLDINDANSVARYIMCVQNDCLRATSEESAAVLKTYVDLAKSEFFKSVKATNTFTQSSENIAHNIASLSQSGNNGQIIAHMTPLKQQIDQELLVLTHSEYFYRRYLNALDIVELRIINKKQEEAVRLAMTGQGS